MAFIAITGANLTFTGKSGRVYQMAFTKATAVGMVTFTNDGQTFWRAPEDVKITDGFIADAINKADSLDLYANSLYTGNKFMAYTMYASLGVNRVSSGWIRAGTQIALYFNSA